MFCHQASKILGPVIVYNYGGQKLSIISNRLATGVMTSPCFLPLVAFFQAAGFMTWEYLITDFNWHKPNTSAQISCWVLFVSTATFWLFRRQSLENWFIFTLNFLVEEVYLCFLPIVTLISGMSCGLAPATPALWLLWTQSSQTEGQSFYEPNCELKSEHNGYLKIENGLSRLIEEVISF